MYYSLIVPSYNDCDALELLLKSYTPPDDKFELIIVDDCSSDDTSEMVRSYPVRYVKMVRNSGPAASRNLGVQEAKGDVIIFCDSDIELGSDALKRIKYYFEQKGVRSMMASGFLLPPNPGFFPLFKHYLEESWLGNNRVEYTEHFSARLGAISKELFLKTGGFDESITNANVEDFEFGHRLAKYIKSRICYDVKFSHRHPTFFKQAKLFFTRASSYIPIMMDHRGLDNIGASSKEASIAASAFLSQFMVILCLLRIEFIFVFFLFFILHIYLSRNLIRITLSKKGVIFSLCSIFVNYILSFFIVTGAGWGMMLYFVKRISKNSQKK